MSEGSYPPLRPLHPESSLSQVKLEQFKHVPTEVLLRTLLPGQPDSLKTRADGTILDGHHRIHILQSRGLNVHALPRDVIMRE